MAGLGPGMAGLGPGMAGPGMDSGPAWPGCMAGLARHGRAGLAWPGWPGMAGLARHGWAGPAWPGWLGMAELARHGQAGPPNQKSGSLNPGRTYEGTTGTE